ncbi:MAG: YkgJ family cysteine cluster protein [Hyphomicrobiales bacterium]|nr:YkgJ family cysteine cluster protein [Hyphomicrobiales bacterium]
MADNKLDPETEVEIIGSMTDPAAAGPVVQPVRLGRDDTFCFSCHKDVPCWNECCHGADITLTPADILMLCRNLDMRPAEFLAEYTVPAIWDKADLPVAKLKMQGADGKGACHFMTDAGCSVYAFRPATCRYYPLGFASVKMKGAEEKDDFHFLVKEAHCKGHGETKTQTVGEYRAEQGIDAYDEVNRGWMDIMMKMASWQTLGGPWGEQITQAKKRMFFMVYTDVDAFRRFVFETRFLDTYEIEPEAQDLLRESDEALLALGFDWLKNVFFNEPTVSMKENVLQGAIAKAREEMGAS